MIRANDDDQGHDRVAAILTRFHNFDDAVVRCVTLSVGDAGERAVISLEARDVESVDPDWRKVRLTIDDVTEYRLARNSRQYHYVLSLGLKVARFEGATYFDFGPATDEPDCLEDFRSSNFYIAGRAYRWKVLPYPKSWERAPRRGGPLASDREAALPSTRGESHRG